MGGGAGAGKGAAYTQTKVKICKGNYHNCGCVGHYAKQCPSHEKVAALDDGGANQAQPQLEPPSSLSSLFLDSLNHDGEPKKKTLTDTQLRLEGVDTDIVERLVELGALTRAERRQVITMGLDSCAAVTVVPKDAAPDLSSRRKRAARDSLPGGRRHGGLRRGRAAAHREYCWHERHRGAQGDQGQGVRRAQESHALRGGGRLEARDHILAEGRVNRERFLGRVARGQAEEQSLRVRLGDRALRQWIGPYLGAGLGEAVSQQPQLAPLEGEDGAGAAGVGGEGEGSDMYAADLFGSDVEGPGQGQQSVSGDPEAQEEETGEVVQHEQGADAGEGRVAIRARRKPGEPTSEDRAEQEVSYVPHRSWCRACVAGRGRVEPHFHIEQQGEQLPDNVADYGFFGDKRDHRMSPLLVMKDRMYGSLGSECQRRAFSTSTGLIISSSSA